MTNEIEWERLPRFARNDGDDPWFAARDDNHARTEEHKRDDHSY